jgi:hypothetical protein
MKKRSLDFMKSNDDQKQKWEAAERPGSNHQTPTPRGLPGPGERKRKKERSLAAVFDVHPPDSKRP